MIGAVFCALFDRRTVGVQRRLDELFEQPAPGVEISRLEVRLAGFEPATYGLGNRYGNSTTTEAVQAYGEPAERLGVLLGALGVSFDGLAAVVKAWPTLPEPIRRAVLALVEASQGSEKKGVAR